MPRLALSLILLAATLLPQPRPAWGGPATSLERKVAEQQNRLKQVQKAMDEKRDLLRASRTREINLLGQLESTAQALNNGRARLTKLQREAAARQQEIQRKSAELAALTSAKEQARGHVEERLAAFYRMGEVGLLNVIFSSSSLPDLLNFREYFQTLIDHDHQLLDTYRQQITELARVRDELARENSSLAQAITTANQQEAQLAAARRERLKLLARVSSEKQLYQQALAEMADAATGLNQTMQQLREKLAASKFEQAPRSTPQKTPRIAALSFAAMKGRLPPPVRGTVTTYFGKSNQGKFGITTSAAGIDIKTLAGAEISAIAKGQVVYVGPLRGYGNLLIIHHGQQYYSLVSRAAAYYKKVGDQVAGGDAIGIMDDQGGILGEGLHFEIRHGTDPENPLEWVNRALLKIDPAALRLGANRKDSKNN